MSVVVGYVPSAEGRAALGYAIRECALRGTDLVVVASGDAGHEPELQADLELARASAGRREVTVQVTGSGQEAGNELVEASTRRDVELVVIGVRRHSPVGKLALGTTAQRVILEAECPVTAVKVPSTPDDASHAGTAGA